MPRVSTAPRSIFARKRAGMATRPLVSTLWRYSPTNMWAVSPLCPTLPHIASIRPPNAARKPFIHDFARGWWISRGQRAGLSTGDGRDLLTRTTTEDTEEHGGRGRRGEIEPRRTQRSQRGRGGSRRRENAEGEGVEKVDWGGEHCRFCRFLMWCWRVIGEEFRIQAVWRG